MKSKQKLWIITEVFYPDQTTTAHILTEIALFMSKYYDIYVLSGPVGYEQGNVATNEADYLKDIYVSRSSCWIKNKNNLFLRTLRQIILTLKLIWKFIFKVSVSDKVLMVTNPAPLLFTMALVRTLKHVELNVLVHDVFPENTLPAGIFKTSDHFLYKVIKTFFSWAYARADRLIVLGRDMQEIIEAKVKKYKHKPELTIVENWADTEIVYPIQRENILVPEYSSEIVLGYAGNYGRVQGLMRLLNSAKNVQNRRIYFRFWGSGAMEEEMKKFVSDNDLKNVEINGCYSRKEQLEVLNSCDIAFVSLEAGMYGLGVPSKTYNILAAGKPIIFIGNPASEVARMIIENEIGWVFDEFEERKLESFLNQLSNDQLSDLESKKEKCRQVAVRKYAKEVILEKFYSVIK